MSEPTFAGQPIAVGDMMHDTADGPIVVIEVQPSRIHARLLGKDQRRVVYNFKGFQSRRDMRTLYWQNPIIIEPLKDTAAWELQRQFLKDINGTFRSYVAAGGHVIAPELKVVETE